MFRHRLPTKLFALLLVAGAVVVGPRMGGSAAAGASGHRVSSDGSNQGNPQALPAILARATPSELAVIRQIEAQKAAALAYDPPASAEYSLAVLNGYSSASN